MRVSLRTKVKLLWTGPGYDLELHPMAELLLWETGSSGDNGSAFQQPCPHANQCRPRIAEPAIGFHL